MDIFASGMAKKWQGNLSYVDLFAGPGRVHERGTDRFGDGSPLLALTYSFGLYAYVDINPQATAALVKRLQARPRGSLARVWEDDCNRAVPAVAATLPARGLTLAFIDPTGWQIRYEAVRVLTEGKRVDLLVTFHAGGMKRVADRDEPRLDAFFGTKRWRGTDGRVPTAFDLLQVYRAQLAALGYSIPADVPVIDVRNSRNVVMYYLFFASKNARGYEFWRKIADVDEHGQPNLRFG